MGKSLPVRGNVSFEDLKKINEHGAEYWSARELQPLLGYSQWRRFEEAINRAITSCKQSGNEPEYILPAPAKWSNLALAASDLLKITTSPDLPVTSSPRMVIRASLR